MKKKIVLFSVIFLVFIGFVFYNQSNFFNEKESTQLTSHLLEQKRIRIAACPTYHDLSERLNYDFIKTESTQESLSLLRRGEVDMILSGRKLRPDEGNYDYEVLGEGYSFISNQGGNILESQLKNYTVYTDLDLEELKRNFSLGEIIEVENVYDYLEKGIAITSWENTDYFQAELIHLLKDSGGRNSLSRRLTLYCSSFCDGNIASEIKSVSESL